MSVSDLPFTGERFIPTCEREIWYEHYHRYTMALNWTKGLDVLDAACGEGYGSHLLASNAKSVTGVDISDSAINHAQKTYTADNLTYIKSNVLNMGFKDGSFDVVVSFETLEHLAEHKELIQEFKRVLKPDGVLIISTPDKKEYSDKTGFDNEFHVKELYREDFANLVEPEFNHCQWFGQKLLFSSTIWDLNNDLKTIQYDCMDKNNQVVNQPLFAPVYFILVASHEKLDAKNVSNFYSFSEQAESVYGHYNAVIRAHIKAEKDCQKLQAQHSQWKNHPIIGRCIKWFGKE
ncbi:class I SAM-dependent methyltransferase [Marinicella litoralis]|uniref:Methyltransferase family protein n=1 Tax=Marinicella litoralis TaxID=644220 RepID=A0A4R6XMD0_9GAMM|nr:class I SAM-dependent methyltransferase [Marinicella litoralis]TDR20815.1 methyltransferase family protein [Marinicella litoralis]